MIPNDSDSDSSLKPRATYPRLWQALGLLLLFEVISIVLTIVAAVLAPSLIAQPLFLGFANLFAIGLVFAWGVRKSSSSLRRTLPLIPIQAQLILPMLLVVIGLSIVTSEVGNLVTTLLPIPQGLLNYFTNVLGGGVSLWGSLFTVGVVAPLTEEFLFRGLILRGFLGSYSVRKAVVASAILFGLFHLNPWQFTGAVSAGIVFGWWRVRTGSLWPCLIGHALLNLVALVTTEAGLRIQGYSVNPTPPVFQPLWFDVLGVVALLTGILVFHRQTGADHARAEVTC